MPFSADFDDVYSSIKTAVQRAISAKESRCFRLDEARPAGRITERLLKELQSASFCVADLTGNRPNVMWEVGYAMALCKPIIIVTQKLEELPFDIRDMQSLQYDRNHLSSSLAEPLHRMVIDTISAQSSYAQRADNQNEFVGKLLLEMNDLKNMVAQAVHSWGSNERVSADQGSRHELITNLEGAWISAESGSHLYAKVVDNDLIAPYCYCGNSELTGVYFGWRKVGGFWFARFQWIGNELSGFEFLKQESFNNLKGAWWLEVELQQSYEAPPAKSGVPTSWDRLKNIEFLLWPSRVFEDARSEGLSSRLARGV